MNPILSGYSVRWDRRGGRVETIVTHPDGTRTAIMGRLPRGEAIQYVLREKGYEVTRAELRELSRDAGAN